MNWTFYNVGFDLDRHFPGLAGSSAWTGHRPFAYDLTRFIRPKRIVELGTQYGISFFTFCQAMREGSMPGKCFAVDTWRGDKHAGYYSEEVFQTVAKLAAHYPGHARLIRSTFDQALAGFQDQSIDLLHIDGLHTLDAVSHDYYAWLPKLAPNGVILFHDIAITTGGFGVYRLWASLKNQYPHHHLAFYHSAGLGVLFPKGLSEAGKVVMANKGMLMNHYK